MKTRRECRRARNVITQTLAKNHAALSGEQLALLYGASSALQWVCDNETEENLVKRLVDGEQVFPKSGAESNAIVEHYRGRLSKIVETQRPSTDEN